MSTIVWRRRQDRLAALFPLFAVALFALLTYWLDARVTESARVQRQSSQPAPDHFLEGFRIERTTADGRVESTVVGDKATHYPATRTTVIERPRYDSEPAGKPRMDVVADRATMHSSEKGGIDRVDFAGKVVAKQAASPGRDALTYESDTLTVFPKTQQAQTDAVTRTTSGDRVMTTRGLRVDAEKKQGQTNRGIAIELRPKDVDSNKE
ncbi:MAG: LPS export ABC transporter periplasmic protein LptC [Burkholderiales bacterium]|nr:LPS export ABC transporter periplasmic protein LptC [Burkholderiales bacterium]